MTAVLETKAVHVFCSTGSETSFTTSFTCQGANRLLVVTTGHHRGAVSDDILSMTYAGASLTQAAIAGGSGILPATLWFLVNPSSGSNTLQVNLESALNDGSACIVHMACFSNVQQSGQPRTTNAASGVSTTPTVGLSSQNDDLVVDSLTTSGGPPAIIGPTAGQTLLNLTESACSSTNRWHGDSYITPSGGVTLTWLIADSGRNWAHAAAAFITLAGTGSRISRSMLGVGL